MTENDKDLSRMTHVRLLAAEHDQFALAAKRLGESRSNLLRRAVREIIGQPVDFLKTELGVLEMAVFQLKAVGRNLNQIVRAIHTGELKDNQIDSTIVLAAIEAFEKLDQRLTEAIDKSRLRRVMR